MSKASVSPELIQKRELVKKCVADTAMSYLDGCDIKTMEKLSGNSVDNAHEILTTTTALLELLLSLEEKTNLNGE